MTRKKQMTLILASASPRRRELLKGMGLRFEVRPTHAEEWEASDADPAELAAHNCLLKARAAAERFPESPILAADTVVSLDNRLLGKPPSLEEAKRTLAALSGRTNRVFTAVALKFAPAKLEEVRVVKSEVTFNPLTAEAIDRYCQLVNTLDKAGAYGIQEHSDIIISGYEGSFSNIMGLPVEETEQLLREATLWNGLKIGGTGDSDH